MKPNPMKPLSYIIVYHMFDKNTKKVLFLFFVKFVV